VLGRCLLERAGVSSTCVEAPFVLLLICTSLFLNFRGLPGASVDAAQTQGRFQVCPKASSASVSSDVCNKRPTASVNTTRSQSLHPQPNSPASAQCPPNQFRPGRDCSRNTALASTFMWSPPSMCVWCAASKICVRRRTVMCCRSRRRSQGGARNRYGTIGFTSNREAEKCDVNVKTACMRNTSRWIFRKVLVPLRPAEDD